MRLRTLRIAILCLAAPVLGVSCWWNQFGGAIEHSSKYSEQRLIGMTEAEVFALLGPPYYDPRIARRKVTTAPWDENADGPLTIMWTRGWAHCGVEFRNGRVVGVRHGMK